MSYLYIAAGVILYISSILFVRSDFTKAYRLDKTEPDLEESIKLGEKIYQDYCLSCHMDEGQGIPKVFPPLAKADYLMADKERSIRQVIHGVKGKMIVNGITYNSVMAPQILSDEETAHVLNYIRNSWGNEGEVVTFAEVKTIRDNP